VILELTISQLWIGLVAGVRAIPIMLLALFGGVISDRFGRRNLMMAAGWHCHIFGRDR
jgi:MFS family permease